MRFLLPLLLVFLSSAASFAVEVSTTISCTYLAWPTTGNHTTQITLSASEQIVVMTSDARRWVTIQLVSTVDWTLRWTQGSSTDAVAVKANQVYNLQVQGTGKTFYPIAGGAGTLYITPVEYIQPN